MSQPIVEALQGFAQAHPEQAQEIITKLADKWESLTPEQQEQVKAKALELRDKVMDMSPEERQAVADQITSLI